MMAFESADNPRLVIPALRPAYAALEPIAEALLRFVAGGALAIHGAGKIGTPFANVGMVESLGFYPGVFWSPLLAATEFFGGILIALGLLTRPAALAGMIVLLVTVFFHWVTLGQGYSGAEKSILWVAMLAYIAVRGGRAFSLDARIGRAI